MLILASAIDGAGGIPVVNRLLLDAASEGAVEGSVVSLQDGRDAAWTATWPRHACAGGSHARFARLAIARRRDAMGSLILVTHVGLAPIGRAVKHLARSRLVVCLHGVEAWSPLPALTELGLRACDLIVAFSNHSLATFHRTNPRWQHIPSQVFYLPARRLDAGGPRDDDPKPTGVLQVLFVGRLEHRGMLKGQRQLIAVWREVLADHADAILWIVGQGAGQVELQQLAEAHGVAEHVRFPGRVSDVELGRLYAACDVFAMPSWGEGFGLVFAEAMSHGLPCIASRFDGGGEVVVDGTTGILVDPERPSEISHALRRLLADPPLRARMGEAGRRRAAELFALSRFNRDVQVLFSNGAAAPGVPA